MSTTPKPIITLNLPPRPFTAIKNRSKRVEYRTTTANNPTDYSVLQPNDHIEFKNEESEEILICKVTRVSHYPTATEMYESEGLANSSSKPSSIAEAVERIEALTGYKEAIQKHGIWAIEFEVVS